MRFECTWLNYLVTLNKCNIALVRFVPLFLSSPLFSLLILFRPPSGGLWDAAQRPSFSSLFTGPGTFPGPQPGWNWRGRGGRWNTFFLYRQLNHILVGSWSLATCRTVFSYISLTWAEFISSQQNVCSQSTLIDTTRTNTKLTDTSYSTAGILDLLCPRPTLAKRLQASWKTLIIFIT